MSRITPANYTLRVPQRATLEESFTLKLNGEPLNLTGCTVLAQIYKDVDRTTKIADLSTVYVNRLTGDIKIQLSRSQTRAIKSGGYWDLLVIYSDNTADYWLEGQAVLDLGLADDV